MPKKSAIQLERVSARWLDNSTGDYETEIRLIKKKDGSFAPFLKLYTIPMRRFSYRKNVVAGSIHPSLGSDACIAGKTLSERERTDFRSVLRSRHDAY